MGHVFSPRSPMRQIMLFLGTLLTFFLGSGAAFASEGSGTSNEWVNLALRIVNIALFIGIIWKFAGKFIKDALWGRREKVEAELKNLEVQKIKAAEELKAMQEKVARVEADCEAILEENRLQAEAQRKAIIEHAQAAARQITDQARKAAESEVRILVAEVRSELADLVTEAARKNLSQALDNAEQEKLIDKYLTKVVLN